MSSFPVFNAFIMTPYGNFQIREDISAKLQQLASVNSPEGGNLKDYLGFPVDNSFTMPSPPTIDGRASACAIFERGMIISRSDLPEPVVIFGFPYAHFRKLSTGTQFTFLGHMSSKFGLPNSDCVSLVGGGLRAPLDNAEIYWHPDLGAAEVHGEIRRRWLELGGVGGSLGFPLTDEIDVMGTDPDGASISIGRMNKFEGGTIYWTAETGAWDVLNPICVEYECQHGGPAGPFGFPISGSMQSSGLLHNGFQHGVLIAKPKSPSGYDVLPVRRLALKLTHVQGRGGTGGRDMYLWIHLTVARRSTSGDVAYEAIVQELHRRIPNNTFREDSGAIQMDLLNVDNVSSDLHIYGSIEGWDAQLIGDDEKLGTYDVRWDISNYWEGRGTRDSELNWVGDFIADFSMQARLPFDPAEVRKDLFWPFRNFDIEELSGTQYSETYSDVVYEENPWVHPFNDLFYNLVYKGCADTGLCFGMCLEAIEARLGKSLLTPPLSRLSTDEPAPNSIVGNAISVKHGYQYGDRAILWFLNKLFQGGTHDPNGVYEESHQAFNTGNYPIIALTSSYFSVGGHIVLPYKWEDDFFDGIRQCKRILVANPSYPYWAETDNGPHSAIYIYEHPDRGYKFRFVSGNEEGDEWSGGEWFGGRMYTFPYHVLAVEPSTPFWEIFALIATGTLILLGGDGNISQIEDDNQRMFYRTDLSAMPAGWDDIVQDAASRIPNLARIPHFGKGSAGFEMYYGQKIQGTLKHSITGKGGEYVWAVNSARLSALVRTTSNPQAFDFITLDRSEVESESLIFSIPREGTAKYVSMNISGKTGKPNVSPRQFVLSSMMLSPLHKLKLTARDFGQSVEIANLGQSDADFVLQMSNDTGTTMGSAISITLRSGENQKFS